MRVLVACEFSGVVRDAFAKRGHDAWSCDILPSESEGNHIQGDALQALNFKKWDMLLAFPPCTHLSSAGAVYWPQKQKDGRQDDAIWFVKELWDAPIKRIAIENPVGILSRIWQKPDQIINPFNFGTPERKKTCLWLKNLPKLIHTSGMLPPAPKGFCIKSTGEKYNYYHHQAKTPHERSRFWPTIADAMAEQWGNL